MNALDDRLTDLLARSAAAVEVHPDIEAVRADDGRRSPVVDLGRRPRDTRRLLALAAAVLVVVGLLGATAALVARDDRPTDLAVTPPGADRFPVLGDLPADLRDAPVEANDGAGTDHSGLTDLFGPDTPTVTAVIGRAAPDGSVSDLVLLAAGAEGEDDRIGPPPGRTEDVGHGYRLSASDHRVELYGPGTTVRATGGSDTVELVRALAGTGLTATVGPDGVPILTLRDLPDGYSVTGPPTPVEAEQAETVVEDDEGLPLVVAETGVGSPNVAIAELAAGGSYEPVDVGGVPGFVTVGQGRTVVAWSPPGGPTARVHALLPAEDVLRIARGTTFVDEATWRAAYPERPDEERPRPDPGPATTAADPTAHPLVGRPVPSIPGVDAGAMAGRVAVVGFAAPAGCADCVDAHVALVTATGREWDPHGFMLDDGGAIVAIGDDDLLAQAPVGADGLADWSITGTPTVVVVGRDGVVRAVFTIPIAVDALEAEVEAALQE